MELRPVRGGRRRRLTAALVLLSLLAVLVWVSARWLLALLILDAILPVGPHPLDVVPRPQVRSVAGLEADLYVPAGGGTHDGLVIVNGAIEQGRRYGPLVGAAEAFARAGHVVLVPELGRLRQYVVGPEIVEDLVTSIQVLRRQPEVRPGPVGLYGFSVGGSFALLAAEDPRVAGSIAFVGDVAGYYRLTDMVQAATTGTIPGSARRVDLDGIVAYTLVSSLVDRLPPGPDRALLEETLARSAPAHPLAAFDGVEPARLSDPNRQVLALIQNREASRVPSLIATQPPAVQELLRLSPAARLDRVRASVWVLHDVDDRIVPVEESRQLAADPRLRGHVDLTTTAVLRHTEFDLTKATSPTWFGTYLPDLLRIQRFIDGTLATLRD